MHTIKLTMEDEIYKNIMFLLSNLKVKGLQIDEIDDAKPLSKTKSKIQNLFLNKKLDMFKDIEDPLAWQKQQRDEW